jgi:uncharacterized protein with PIN domain
MTFIVDGMLGRLAKWLKILGFDVFFQPGPDDLILAEARREGRTLLSCDRELIRRAGGLPALLIESPSWKDQVLHVLDHFDLRAAARPFSRCLECNAPLKPLSRDAAGNLVSPHVLATADEFSLCPNCGRCYWPGTHHAAMAETIRRFLESY